MAFVGWVTEGAFSAHCTLARWRHEMGQVLVFAKFQLGRFFFLNRLHVYFLHVRQTCLICDAVRQWS